MPVRAPLRSNWNGYYLDGQSPRRQEVTVLLSPEGIRILKQNGTELWWVYGQIHPVRTFRWGEPVLLEKKDSLGEGVVVLDREFLEALSQFAPVDQFPARADRPHYSRVSFLLIGGAALAALTAGIYLWGIPALSRQATAHLPLEWEEQLGDQALEQLAPVEDRCTDSQLQRTVEAIGQQLMSAAPPSPYGLRLLVLDHPAVNAFAAPGGRIVVFRGLLEKTDRAEELAGVLAHEIQHVLLRHPTQAMLRQLSLQTLAAVMAGDSSGLATALGTAGTIGGLRYQRRDEQAADREAASMLLAAGIDPVGLIEMFEKLAEDHGRTPQPLQYLSSHPLTEARIAELRRLVEQSDQTPAPLLPDVDWAAARTRCTSE